MSGSGPVLTRRALLGASAAGGLMLLAGCGSGSAGSSPAALALSAIPDQDPEKLNRLYPLLATRMSDVLGKPVAYRAVTDYTAVVRGFQVSDIYLSWMGGLTGVQARALVPGSTAIAQRDIDAAFHSLFIANQASGLKPFSRVSGLTELAGHTFTFGSETSTSGRLMPQYFLQQSGLALDQLKGSPGFSGSHDATIAAVASGSFEVGAVNQQVWNATKTAGKVDLSAVSVLWETPAYQDYHWLARPDLDQVLGAGTTASVTSFLLGLDPGKPDDATILGLFGAKKFVATQNSNYDKIESIARSLQLLS